MKMKGWKDVLGEKGGLGGGKGGYLWGYKNPARKGGKGLRVPGERAGDLRWTTEGDLWKT